ncbi:brp/Blh family beta-carotene 15,15'-monooxygenase [Actinomyces sp. oral taxon 180 str. F0310]|nr:brp/Blh family beta-carotene 15,15'-monooxygenase [Actinomyces sp. oral taxon 180 str. F0310]
MGTLIVMLLAALTIAAWWLPGSRWSVGPVVAVASFLLALGWPSLARLHMPWLAQAVLALGGALTPVAVAYWKNLDIAIPLTGITLVALVAATILDAPAPRDHSVGRTSEHWGSTSLTAALASSVTALLIVTAGSMWVSLTVHERWSVIVPMAALIALVAAASARTGRSSRAVIVWSIIMGLVAGLVAASAAWILGQTSDLLPVVFPFIARRFGDFAAFLTLGGVTGFGVGFAVSVVDVLLGERTSSAQLASVLGRGAAKFLVAALPVYAMIRIGGI